MKNSLISISLLLLVTIGVPRIHADELVFAGILANSGEAGRTLVISKPMEGRTGIGVALDRKGRLWSRAGRGLLNCYEQDGRLVRQYKIDGNVSHLDSIAATDRLIVLMIRGVIWTLPINASQNRSPKKLLTNIIGMATRSFNNRVLVQLKNNTIHWLNPVNGKLDLVSFDPTPTKGVGLIVAPNGEVFLNFARKIHRYVNGKEINNDRWPKPATSERIQPYGEAWYGHAWHSTVKRYDVNMNPDPGVVLGGGSGSFIGFLPENPEIINGRGMIAIGKNTFAIAGIEGILHLIQYDSVQQRMQLIRRIGSLTSCPTLAINEQGIIWAAGGTWPWDGLPDTAMPEGDRAGQPTSQMVIMPNGYAVCFSTKYGKPGIAYGPYVKDGMTRVSVRGLDTKKFTTPLAKNYPAAAHVKFKKRRGLLLISDTGVARVLRISDRGEFQGDLGHAELSLASPVKTVTSLAKVNDDTLLMAADNAIITLTQHENGWKETDRFTQWGNASTDRLGNSVFVASHNNRIWISDTTRHRVVVLDRTGQKLLASFGITDNASNKITTLNAPTSIAVKGERCVVYDSENQRLVRLRFQIEK